MSPKMSRLLRTIRDQRTNWMLGMLCGSFGTCAFQTGLVFIQKEADVEKPRNENTFLKAYTQRLDTEIARLEEALREEARLKEAQHKFWRWLPWTN